MITVTVEQKQGATTRQMKVSAPSIERALHISGSGRPDTEVRVVFPIGTPDAEEFFAPTTGEGINYTSMTPEEIEDAYDAGLPGALEAWSDLLKDDLGEDAYEAYAYDAVREALI
ncbi:MAG: hypothetical protein ACFB50_14645 [Rubrobacteraceae bacterium]